MYQYTIYSNGLEHAFIHDRGHECRAQVTMASYMQTRASRQV